MIQMDEFIESIVTKRDSITIEKGYNFLKRKKKEKNQEKNQENIKNETLNEKFNSRFISYEIFPDYYAHIISIDNATVIIERRAISFYLERTSLTRDNVRRPS